jgi:surface antigen/uncharacterized protein YukE
MTQIRINVNRVREVGRRLISEADHIGEMASELGRAINNLDTWAWDGVSRSRADPLLSRAIPEAESAARQLDHLGRILIRVANTFEQRDQQAYQHIDNLPWVDFSLVAGAVATIATAAITEGIGVGPVPMPPYDSNDIYLLFEMSKYRQEVYMMSWAERFEEEAELQMNIESLEVIIEMRKSDPHAIRHIPPTKDLERELALAKQKLQHVQATIEGGVPTDGPTEDGWGRYGCVKYVAKRRDISGVHGNAYELNENAQAAGYEVGNRPVKGAVMVIESNTVYGVVGQNNTPTGESSTGLGHAAYVENVSEGSFQGEDGFWVTIKDSGGENPNIVNEKQVFVPASGTEGVSFIYGKPSDSPRPSMIDLL